MMGNYTKEDLEAALQVVSSAIRRCETAQRKFVAGTPQHTLLKNRIKALYISQSLIAEEHVQTNYTQEELKGALPPISSIISKCEKAQLKFAEGNLNYARFKKMIEAMYIVKSMIIDEVSKR